MDFCPSYSEYERILDTLIGSGKMADFCEAKELDSFVILRHDIEFSVERAHKMSLIETQKGVCSTYFVQLCNNAYNALSIQNADLINDMHLRGHHIGLHYHVREKDPIAVREGIVKELSILSDFFGFEIDRYSMHRPTPETRYYETHIDGAINAYSKEFFTFAESVSVDFRPSVKYIADSRHRWNYGCPDKETINGYPKIQLLIHPDFWSENGYDAEENFKSLISDNRINFMETLDSECNHFHQFKDVILFE